MKKIIEGLCCLVPRQTSIQQTNDLDAVEALRSSRVFPCYFYDSNTLTLALKDIFWVSAWF
jgi:hypothetical protein